MAFVDYRMYVGCLGAGSSANLAVVTLAGNTSDVPLADFAANMIAAYAGYGQAAANVYIHDITYAPSTGGGGALSIPFPLTEYATLVGLDSNLPALSGYGDANIGGGDLTVLGAGPVVRKFTGLAGRSGYGRNTLPWLSKNAVNNAGQLPGLIAAAMDAAFNQYWRDGAQARLVSALGNHYVTEFRADTRLGRVRSRSV